MTIEEAIARWRLLTPEQVEEERANNPEFRHALDLAIEHALESNDPAARFWHYDSTGAHPKQINVAMPPAPPQMNGAPEPDSTERERRRTPIKGAAFPS
jgi:hypothetical protein